MTDRRDRLREQILTPCKNDPNVIGRDVILAF
jgi:hypothetical protein